MRDHAPGVDLTPGICGGEVRIVRTCIPVWTLEQARRLGMSEADLLASFPTLPAEDLANAWRYVHLNTQEIERAIAENEESAGGDALQQRQSSASGGPRATRRGT